MTSNVARYHIGAIALHWVVAFVLIANLLLGLLLEDIADADKFQAYQWHKSLGVTVLLLGVLRLVWRLTHMIPADLPNFKPWEITVSKITHVLFYVLMIGIPLTGWMIVSASPRNFPTMLFGLLPWPHLPFLQGFVDQKEVMKSISDVHGALAYGILVLLVLHVGAALRHHFMLKDDVLLRMTPAWKEKCLRKIRGEKV
jgi:cytochrome b561